MAVDFIDVDNIMISSEIFEQGFQCDLNKCKGACCTMESAFGAPINKKEVESIEKNLSIITEYLPSEHSAEIKKNGFWISKFDQLMTRSLNNRACVFVVFEGDVAKCSIEKAFNDSKINFNKPISCHLFPIRIGDFNGKVLRFEKYHECSPALEKGSLSQTNIFEFCKDALVREFGESWYDKTMEAIKK
ncbi:MAG: DUF3109 family protein [Ignavibacteria bacterium]|nr:DUF3109 family protein [Ignavibacteria bacterium]